MIRRYTHFVCDMPECPAFHDMPNPCPRGWLPRGWSSIGLTRFDAGHHTDAEVAIICERCAMLLREAGTRNRDEVA